MHSPDPNRPRRKTTLAPEPLEDRKVMTSGAGSTFAIINQQVSRPDLKLTVPITINSSLFTAPKGHLTIGIDVAPKSGSTVVPEIYGLMDTTTHKMVPIAHAAYAKAVPRTASSFGTQTTAVTATINVPTTGTWSKSYAVVVGGMGQSTGGLLVGFYLPGDANGDGAVTKDDITAIKAEMGVNATNAKYTFAADANRDGQINAADLAITMRNMGVTTKVTPVISANLDPASDSGLQDRITNIKSVHFTGTSTPGGQITYAEIHNLAPTTSTVVSATGTYNLTVPLGPGKNTFQVTGTDAFGQTISGQISPVTYSLDAAPSPTTTATSAASPATATGTAKSV